MTVAVRLASFALLAPLVVSGSPAHAEVGQCHVVDVQFTPAINENGASSRHEPSQIVAWVEKPDGTYVDTVYITAQTGRYGLGNRPGRFDFNSGPMFPYGRRITTFPVWAHRKVVNKQTGEREFPAVIFQNCCFAENASSDDPNFCSTLIIDPTKPSPWDGEHRDCGENNLSHPFNQSSLCEKHYCQPLQASDGDWALADAMTCATQAYTDKGKLSASNWPVIGSHG